MCFKLEEKKEVVALRGVCWRSKTHNTLFSPRHAIYELKHLFLALNQPYSHICDRYVSSANYMMTFTNWLFQNFTTCEKSTFCEVETKWICGCVELYNNCATSQRN